MSGQVLVYQTTIPNSMKTCSASCEQIKGVTVSITGTFQVMTRVALLGQAALPHMLTAQQRVPAS